MRYNIRGEKVEVTEAIKDYITNKIGRLDKYFADPDSVTASILIKLKGHNQAIEVTIPTQDFILRNESSEPDLYAAIDLSTDKLERQIRKNKTKINNRNYKVKIKDFEVEIEDEFEEIETKIIKRKSVYAKPMDEEEAILQMNMLDHNFFVYKDAETNDICVVYKRSDGQYGVISAK